MWENVKQFSSPILIGIAVIVAWVLFSRRAPSLAAGAPTQIGIDPQYNAGDGQPAYLAEIPNFAMRPSYVEDAVKNPYSQAPNGVSGPDGATAGDDGAITTYNSPGVGGGSNPWNAWQSALMPADTHSGCGCGGSCGGCEPKCSTPCDSNVRLSDGRGSCLTAENFFPPMFYFGVDPNGYDAINLPA